MLLLQNSFKGVWRYECGYVIRAAFEKMMALERTWPRLNSIDSTSSPEAYEIWNRFRYALRMIALYYLAAVFNGSFSKGRLDARISKLIDKFIFESNLNSKDPRCFSLPQEISSFTILIFFVSLAKGFLWKCFAGSIVMYGLGHGVCAKIA